MCNCFSGNNTTRCLLFCFYLLLLLSIVQLHCTYAHILVHSCVLRVCAFFWWASPFNWQKTSQPAAKKRLKPKTFWTLKVVANAHALAWGMGMWQLWQQLAAADSCRNIYSAHTIHAPDSSRSSTPGHIREGKSKTRNSRDFTIYFDFFFVFFLLLSEACNKIKIY